MYYRSFGSVLDDALMGKAVPTSPRRPLTDAERAELERVEHSQLLVPGITIAYPDGTWHLPTDGRARLDPAKVYRVTERERQTSPYTTGAAGCRMLLTPALTPSPGVDYYGEGSCDPAVDPGTIEYTGDRLAVLTPTPTPVPTPIVPTPPVSFTRGTSLLPWLLVGGLAIMLLWKRG